MARQAKNGTSTTDKDSRPSKSTAEDLLEIEGLVSDLEKRLQRLNGAVKREASGASDDVSEFVHEALGDVSERLRESVRSMAQSVSEEAVRAGADTLNRIAREVDHRPFALLAAAAGIGFLLGLATRRL
jgi:ElaB/YqjD/DUF883 family membrane-anchored ribosome-binding protein